jgi:hypothetical protein
MSVAAAYRVGMTIAEVRPALRRDPSRPLETEYRPRHPLDFRRTVLYQRHGGGDPTMVIAGSVIWRASRTPDGVATLALREVSPGVVRGAAWGPGAEWAITLRGTR